MRTVYNFNADWRFHLGDIEQRNYAGIHEAAYASAEWMKTGNLGLAKAVYPDAEWEAVNLPHDFLIDTGFSPEANLSHGSIEPDVGWYRKTFLLPEACQPAPGKPSPRVWLEFDGVFRDCQVWMNGHFVGRHLSGYTSFQFDVTDLCLEDELNTIAVRADARDFELWSYEGGGIYRDVRLVVANPIHIEPNGTWIRTQASGEALGESAEVSIQTKLRNALPHNQAAAKALVSVEIKDANGFNVGWAEGTVELIADETTEHTLQAVIKKPALWSPDTPNLYTAVTTVHVDGALTDQTQTRFGVREVSFDAEQGMFLNGEAVKLKGVCNHQDHAGVGIAIPDALQAWRLHQLKEMGCTALRTAHNPPTPALLDLCDEIGLLVMDETRMVGTSHEVLGQMQDLIERDRNHPCVFAWSIGNEEMAVQERLIGVRQMRRMQDTAHKLDPDRPVTYAMNCHWLNIAQCHDDAGFRLDLYGTNYVCREPYDNDGVMYSDFHEQFPDWPMLASESGGSAAVRGVYAHGELDVEHQDSPIWSNPERKDLVSAYNETMTPWGSTIQDTWHDCASRPYVAGTFLWTGFDYRGETYPMKYPAVITGYGLMDLCGFLKDSYHYYRAWWTPEPTLHLFPHWNWAGKEGEPIDVVCYTNTAEAELWVSGVSQGRQQVEVNGFPKWRVPFAPGKIEAVGYDAAGNETVRQAIETTGPASTVTLAADRTAYTADGKDVAVITVAAQDEQGRFVPTAQDALSFEIDGPATILGVGNGNPISHELDRATERKLFNGLAQVLVQLTRDAGTVCLTTRGGGLADASITFEAEAGETQPWIPSAAVGDAETTVADKTAIDDAL